RVVAVAAAPGTGFRGVVEDRIETFRGGAHGVAHGEVAADLAHADRVERGVVAAVEAGDFVTTLDQSPAQRLPEEATATGDEDLHDALRVAAHAASFSRPILALCLMSTGNRGWNTNASMRAVCANRAPMARSSRSMRACCAASMPASASMQSTARCAPRSPMPTRAVRRTCGCVLNTGSTCSVYSGPSAASTRCDLRPQNQRRPSRST